MKDTKRLLPHVFSFKEHKVTHTGVKQYSCENCDKLFLQSVKPKNFFLYWIKVSLSGLYHFVL